MNIGIIGLGLIGGSLAKACKKAGHTVFGHDIDEDTLLKARLVNAVDERLTDDRYKEIDMLFIALYPTAFKSELASVLPKLKNGTIVLDIAGVKKDIVVAMRESATQFPHLKFIATHPMAGKEYWGINHASDALFDGASVLITQVQADMDDLICVKKLFLAMGVGNITMTSASVHDKMIAYTSQLAHLISSSYIKSPQASSHDGYSAGSFRDLTRVARLNAPMWSELILDNKENVIKELDIFISNITDYRNALGDGNKQELEKLLTDGNARKESIDKATIEWERARNENN